jgi:hypothetical protein
MIPAIRAAAKTSPFLALPASAASSAIFCITTLPSAMAMRAVLGLAETSTISACPLLERWLRPGMNFLMQNDGSAPDICE